ncbi:RDD family protein [Ketobacter sp. MCCC 1A13808]|uniref:RDD family protein n=1 Tax=Ketobacter sp. MCCC 1A13808 TaxID=2602738 RepID=UPI000F267CD9|nr:RDD family protein [Ketobacter sp. MCCC 1A13808]MVF10771.1 RDD family protein [Ketobacter sp. MCCC 1A13808]RLP56184.1 MAG: RDD family protein [Ketobacter sp.]
MLDTARKLETPEAIDLEIHVAGATVRILAFSIDSIIRLVFQMIVGIVFAILGDFGIAFMMILTFVLEWFYPVLFEVLNNGQTPGKKAMGIAVVNDDSTPIGWSASIIRNFLRIVDMLPFGYLAGLVSISLNPDFKRIGDLAAGTLVVYRDKASVPPQWPDIKSAPPPVPLNLLQQRAILSFAERHGKLTAERQCELANHLQPVLKKQDQDAVNYLLRIATWLRGSK